MNTSFIQKMFVAPVVILFVTVFGLAGIGCGGGGDHLEKKFDSVSGDATDVEMPQDESKYKLLSELPTGDYILESTRVSIDTPDIGIHTVFPYDFASRSLKATDCKLQLKQPDVVGAKGRRVQLTAVVPVVAARLNNAQKFVTAETWNQEYWARVDGENSCSAISVASKSMVDGAKGYPGQGLVSVGRTERLHQSKVSGDRVDAHGIYELKTGEEYIVFIQSKSGAGRITYAAYYRKTDLNSQTIRNDLLASEVTTEPARPTTQP